MITLCIVATIGAAGLSQVEAPAGLYAPLLHERYHAMPASRMSVKDEALAMPALRGSSEWLKQFGDLPLELRSAASRPSPTRPHALDVSLLPAGTRVVSAAAVDRIFAGGNEDGWSEFRRQFKSDGWLAFSAPVLTDDGLNALVYYEARCGGLCGERGYVWLRRDIVRAEWRIAKKIVRWMS